MKHRKGTWKIEVMDPKGMVYNVVIDASIDEALDCRMIAKAADDAARRLLAGGGSTPAFIEWWEETSPE